MGIGARISMALFVGATVLAGITAAPVLGTHSADSGVERPVSLQPNVTGLEADWRDLQITVRPDGTAVWEVEYRTALESENATARFEALEERIDDLTSFSTGIQERA